MNIRLILNGQKAGGPSIRDAISYVRKHHYFALDVRTSGSADELTNMVKEAQEDGVERLIIGGGDGTANQALNAMMEISSMLRPEMAIIPLGTANDFAAAAGIPSDPTEALLLAIYGKAAKIDIAQVNDRYFLNVASGGFGARVTAETSPRLKDMLGGSAYAVTGFLKLLNFIPMRGTVRIEGFEFRGSAFATAVCNGRQAGGGVLLAPEAMIDDGRLEIVLFTLDEFPVMEYLSFSLNS